MTHEPDEFSEGRTAREPAPDFLAAQALTWHAEPKRWRLDRPAMSLQISPDAGTDFWQRTHYGFEVDNGHFLYQELSADFVFSARVAVRPVHQYDQAGLMVRVSRACWLKTSVEFEPGRPNRLGAVVTNAQYSDWSTQPLDSSVSVMHFRIRAEAGDYIVEAAADGVNWEQIRMARLVETSSTVKVGLYACSPKGEGFDAQFSSVALRRGRLEPMK